MENFSEFAEEEQMELPPGFRFHPTDEELITHYLSKKVVDSKFSAREIGEVDMNKVEPWEMPSRGKLGGNELYFFCLRDKKYPTGLRTNRATAAGYWKATGKDKEIFRGKSLVGMKKTLVFYKGRAPKGENTNWVTHEYRMEGKLSLYNLPKTAKIEWVICRVFQKASDGKKMTISGLVGLHPDGNGFVPVVSPPLVDYSAHSGSTKPGLSESIHVHCFSNPIEIQKSQEDDMMNCFNNPSGFLTNLNSWANHHGSSPWLVNLQNNGGMVENQAILKGLLQTDKEMRSASQETGLSNEMNADEGKMVAPSTSAGELFPIDDCLWNY